MVKKDCEYVSYKFTVHVYCFKLFPNGLHNITVGVIQIVDDNLKQQVNKNKLFMIVGSTEFFDKDYADVLPIEGFAF